MINVSETRSIASCMEGFSGCYFLIELNDRYQLGSSNAAASLRKLLLVRRSGQEGVCGADYYSHLAAPVLPSSVCSSYLESDVQLAWLEATHCSSLNVSFVVSFFFLPLFFFLLIEAAVQILLMCTVSCSPCSTEQMILAAQDIRFFKDTDKTK